MKGSGNGSKKIEPWAPRYAVLLLIRPATDLAPPQLMMVAIPPARLHQLRLRDLLLFRQLNRLPLDLLINSRLIQPGLHRLLDREWYRQARLGLNPITREGNV